MLPAYNKYLSSLFGLTSKVDEFTSMATDQDSSAILFSKELFPGLKGLLVHLPFFESRPRCGLSSEACVEVIAESPPGNTIAWECRHGEGKIIYWNTMLHASRISRGLIIQSLLSTQSISVQPVVNAGVIHVDDFPAGFVDRRSEPIASEFDMSMVEFFHQVWLPDILKLSKEFDIRYTFFVPFTYNGLTAEPFNFHEWESAKISKNGSQFLFSVESCKDVASAGELALHGYNHIPLLVSQWKNKKNMVLGLTAAIDRWQSDNLGPLPTSFAPAMNEFDSTGLAALAEAVPTLKTICSSFMGDFSTGEGREFGLEPWNKKFFSLPRVTFGYQMTPEGQFALLSTLATLGVWSHFIHPDDVFDNPINNKNASYYRNPGNLRWRETNESKDSMSNQLRGWFDFVENTYPWLRYLQTNQASELIQNHLLNKVKVIFEESQIKIYSKCRIDFYLRIDPFVKLKLDNLKDLCLLHSCKLENDELYIFRIISKPSKVIKIPIEKLKFNEQS